MTVATISPLESILHSSPLNADELLDPCEVRYSTFYTSMSAQTDKLSACIQQIKDKLYAWDFNVFQLHKDTEGRPLYAVTMAILEDQGLLDGWLLDRAVVARYITQVEANYHEQNPYHNNTHAADVTQTAAVLMKSFNAWMTAKGRPLTQLQRFAIIFSSAVHDLAHPGVNNDFLIRKREKQALVYNDRSVNENMHVSMAFQLALLDPELNIFAKFSTEQYREVRSFVVDMVLSTDMAVHFDLLKRFEEKSAPTEPTDWDREALSTAFQMLVHLADLANPSRPSQFALKWAERVISEFLSQGEQEAELGLGVSPMCDPKLVCMPSAQLFFIDRFMRPTLEAFSVVAPSFATLARQWLQDTQRLWKFYLDAGVKFPQHMDRPYPELPAELQQLHQQLTQVELAQ